MKVQFFFPLFFGAIILVGCQACGETNIKNTSEERSLVVVRERLVYEDGVVRMVVPEPLCSFTVEVYPKVLHFGDPLYVRLNYKNNTDVDAYVYADTDFVAGRIECGTFAFHLRAGDVIIPWNVRSGFFDGGFGLRRWQKVKSGEKGPTQYAAFIPPHAWVAGGLSDHFTATTLLVNADNYALPRWAIELWERIRTSPVLPAHAAQLVIIINNRHGTLMVASPRFDIIPREQEEMQMLGLGCLILVHSFAEERKFLQRKDIEHIIPKMTPGTLQNLLKYELLLAELVEPLEPAIEEFTNEQQRTAEQLREQFGFHGMGGTPEQWEKMLGPLESEIVEYLNRRLTIDEKLETHILETLGKIEVFLKSLHEIERENLKRIPEQRHFIEMWTQDSEKIQKRLIEVFGERFVPIRLPNTGWSGGIEQ